jgi:hypothetical protein
MNTPGENAYQELFSGQRMEIITREVVTRTHNIHINRDILNDFEKWKLEFVENTDAHPTEMDVLNYFKDLNTNRTYSDVSTGFEVVSIMERNPGDNH